MVLVADKKYACETCIKGHRSSTCKHTDRPLYEIKKKGRPVTQCEHCRELRKIKQVHVKCMCGAKDQKDPTPESDTPSAPSSPPPPVGYFRKKGGKTVPASAAFPSGLPETLGASVALSEGSDSERGTHEHSQTCMCDATGVCNCFTPRTSAPRTKRSSKGVNSKSSGQDAEDEEPRMNQPAALAASANAPGKRPVLPRPAPSSERASPPRATLSSSVHSHGTRIHPSSFSPYERAYEYAHGAEVGAELPASFYAAVQPQSSSAAMANLASNASFPGTAPSLPPQEQGEDMAETMAAWLLSLQQQTPDMPPSCDCGPNCACAGCVVHRTTPAVPESGEICVNSSTCGSCMECIMLSITQESPAIEEWLRRLSSTVTAPQSLPSDLQRNTAMPSFAPPQDRPHNFDPSMWQTYALWPNMQSQMPVLPPPEDAASTCCGGQCRCSDGACTCPADCCGCCAGCTCPDCEHDDRSMGSGKTLTFAVSGERSACCSGSRRSTSESQPSLSYGQQSPAGPSRLGGHSAADLDSQVPFDFTGQQLDLRGAYDWRSSMDMPRVTLSRASSTSSRASSHHSHSSHGSQHRSSASPNPLNASGNTENPTVGACCTSMETAVTLSTGGSAPSSPIPLSFTPSPNFGLDHRTFTGFSSPASASSSRSTDLSSRKLV